MITAMMDGAMGSMLGWMMNIGILGWVLVIALLVTVLVAVIQWVTQPGSKDLGGSSGRDQAADH